MALNQSHLYGQNTRLVYFQDGTKVTLDAKTWSIKANVTKTNDGVNGELRDRLHKIVNFYEITIQCYLRDAKLIQAFLADQLNEDAQVAPLNKQASFRLYPRDGTKVTFVVENVVWDDMDINQGGRDSAMMVTCNMRAQDVREVQAI